MEKQLFQRLKSAGFLAATGMLLLGILVGTNLQGSSVQAQRELGSADVDYFLKLEGVPGESADEKHKGEIELLSYSWGKDQVGLEQTIIDDGTGGGAGKVKRNDITFTQRVSMASPLLMQATASGKHIKEAVLSVRKAGKQQHEFLTIKMSEVMVSSYQTSGHDGSLPTDQFSLNFAKIEFSYTPQKADGTLDSPVIGTWDFKQNKAF